ncbi:MAG: DHHA1 domain-containing protein [Sphaerochaeta sp.]|jgi:oligoribonuclease NrnB/cAMP/cGMP phosphodiesterase (DHH superfamily)
MDGIASAFIANHVLSKRNELTLLPIQYGNYQVEDFKAYDELFIVDFCLKEEELIYLNERGICITIIDHHITNKDVFINTMHIENINFNFDISKSGAVLTYEYFEKIDPSVKEFPKELFLYIQDRDMWKWEMPNSKEISEALSFLVQKNDLLSFESAVYKFLNNRRKLIETGEFLLKKQQNDINVAIKEDKLKFTTLLDHDIVMLNATSLISEIGNTLCKTYNRVALMYFITQELNVVLSFRSLDTLPDASILAKHFGGGGHRNACGAQMSIEDFGKLFKGE